MKIRIGQVRVYLCHRVSERLGGQVWLGVCWDRWLPVLGGGFLARF